MKHVIPTNDKYFYRNVNVKDHGMTKTSHNYDLHVHL